MSNPTDPVLPVNAIAAIADSIELRNVVKFRNCADAVAFIAALVAQNAIQGYGIQAATQAEMQAGTVPDLRAVSPLRVAQAISALAIAASALDTDGTLAANSDTRVASQKAVKTYVTAAVNALVAGAPGALDTLNELATALGNDVNFSTTVTNALAAKGGITNFGVLGFVDNNSGNDGTAQNGRPDLPYRSVGAAIIGGCSGLWFMRDYNGDFELPSGRTFHFYGPATLSGNISVRNGVTLYLGSDVTVNSLQPSGADYGPYEVNGGKCGGVWSNNAPSGTSAYGMSLNRCDLRNASITAVGGNGAAGADGAPGMNGPDATDPGSSAQFIIDLSGYSFDTSDDNITAEFTGSLFNWSVIIAGIGNATNGGPNSDVSFSWSGNVLTVTFNGQEVDTSSWTAGLGNNSGQGIPSYSQNGGASFAVTGADGSTGSDGSPGQDGGAGGNIVCNWCLIYGINSVAMGGGGGPGGAGGAGGSGGHGFDGGNDGSSGNSGNPGPNGNQGLDGSVTYNSCF